jgi:large subunit ribosomal protein L29
VFAMKMKEIQEKQGEQLGHELLEKLKHLYDLRSQAVTEKLEDPSQIGKTRKDIARIKTAMRQRELEQQRQAEAAKPAAAPQQNRQEKGNGRKAPAFGRKARVNAHKQKVRARKTGGGKTASRKVAARVKQYRTRRRGKAANSR